MGAWGVDTFENDNACDYAADIAQQSNLEKLESTLDRVLKTGAAYLEAPYAEEALAAADILARLQGHFGKRDAYTETIDKWVEHINLTPAGDLIDKARRCIARILTEPSELLELWEESSDFELWKSCVTNLQNRLSGK